MRLKIDLKLGQEASTGWGGGVYARTLEAGTSICSRERETSAMYWRDAIHAMTTTSSTVNRKTMANTTGLDKVIM